MAVAAAFAFFATSGVRGAAECTTRVVSLLPSFTETAFELGRGDCVVGVSDFCRYPEAARTRPHVGGFLNPNIERIVALRPTVVVLSNAQKDLEARLGALSITTRSFATDSLEDVFALLHESGRLLGCAEEARHKAAQWRACLDEIGARWPGRPRVRTLVVVSRQPASLKDIYVAGRRSYLGELVERAGAQNVAPDRAHAYPPMTKEEIIAANPDVIIDLSLGEQAANPAASTTHIAAWQALPSLAAVRNHKIYAIADPHLTVPGPAMCQTAETMAKLLHGEGGNANSLP